MSSLSTSPALLLAGGPGATWRALRQSAAGAGMRRRFAAVRHEIYEDLIDVIANGAHPRDALLAHADILERRGSPLAQGFRHVVLRMEQGHSVSVALAHLAPPGDVALLSAFEGGRRLVDGLRVLNTLAKDERTLRDEAWRLLSMPLVYAFLGFCLLAFGVPTMVDMIGPMIDPRIRTADQTALIILAGFIKGWTLPIVVVSVIAGVAFLWSLANWQGPARRWCDRWVAPYAIYRAYRAAAFLKGLAAQLESRPKPSDALGAIRALSDPWLAGYIDRVLDGFVLHPARPIDAFDVGLLDRETVDALLLVGRYGTPEAAISSRADQALDRASKSIRRGAKAIQSLVLGVVGVVIIWVVFSLVLQTVKINMNTMGGFSGQPAPAAAR